MSFKVTLFCVYLFLSSILSANVPIDRSEGRLVGGHEAVPHSHPFLVSLQVRFLWVRAHTCGGSLLSEKWILTAGHCVKGSWLMKMLSLDAIAGAHDIQNFGAEAQIESIARRIPHPKYKGSIGPYDIAMLETKRPFTLTKVIQPIQLPLNNRIYDPSNLMLGGWGALKTTMFIPDLPNKLQEVNVTYIPYKECYAAVDDISDDGTNPLDKEGNICSGPLTGGVAACSGDSGGPLIQYISKNAENDPVEEITEENAEDDYLEIFYKEDKNSNNVRETNIDDEKMPVILGVVSWGMSPCGHKGAPTVYTKVSAYMDFITKYLN